MTIKTNSRTPTKVTCYSVDSTTSTRLQKHYRLFLVGVQTKFTGGYTMNITINSTPITETKEFEELHNKKAELYNSFIEQLEEKEQNKLIELYEAIEAYNKLFYNSIEFNGRLYSFDVVI